MVFLGDDELGIRLEVLGLEARLVVVVREFSVADGWIQQEVLERAEAERGWIVCLCACSRRKRFLGIWRIEL